MKRLVLTGLVLVVVAAAAAHWHVASQVEERLATIATRLAPIGQLKWKHIRIDPRGSVTVRGLSFQPHDHRDRLSIEHLMIDAGNPAALLRLDRILDSGRLPAALNITVGRLNLPVNRQMDGWTRTAVAPLSFIAAGCPAVDPLRYHHLGELGWWEVTLDAQFGYQIVNQGENLELSGRVHAHHLAEGRLRVRLTRPPDAPERMDSLVAAAALERAQWTVSNRGFYQRLIEYCANRAGLSRDAFRERHQQAWEERWQARGLQPGRLVVAGYRHFLDQPETLTLSLNPEPSIDLAQLTALSGSRWHQRLRAQFSVNDGSEVELRFEPVSASATTGTDPGTPEPIPAEPLEPAPSETGSTQSEHETPASIAGRAFGPVPQWQAIDLERAHSHIGSRVRLELADGSRYSGRLAAIDDDNLHLSIRNRLGQMVRPLPRAEVVRVEVRP